MQAKILVFLRFLQTSLLSCTGLVAIADDWPQWMGPLRDSVWREDGIIGDIPDTGLPRRWSAPVQLGYSGPAVADGRVFVMDYVRSSGEFENQPSSKTKLAGQERVLCFSAADGRLLWEYKYDQPYLVSYAGGPRCTPTVSDGLVFTLGTEGQLLCLNAENGKPVWSKLLTEDFETETPLWGFASHPLVDGDLLYVIVGGQGSECVAFDKRTGKEVWRALSASEPGYCPPTMIEHAGTKQLLVWHPNALCGLDPADGSVYWSLPLEVPYGMTIAAPRKVGSHLYVSAMQSTSTLIKLDDMKPAAEFVWKGTPKDSVYCSNSTPFLEDGMIYGCDIETGALVGARLADGTRLWETKEPTNNTERRPRHATAFIVKHFDRFILFSELGDLIFARLSSQGYDELDRSHVIEPTNDAFGRPVVWCHPAFANRCMFVRNDRELICVDLAER